MIRGDESSGQKKIESCESLDYYFLLLRILGDTSRSSLILTRLTSSKSSSSPSFDLYPSIHFVSCNDQSKSSPFYEQKKNK